MGPLTPNSIRMPNPAVPTMHLLARIYAVRLKQMMNKPSSEADSHQHRAWHRHGAISALGLDSSRAESQVPGPNVGQLAAVAEECRVGPDIGLVCPKGAKVRVATDVVELLKVVNRLVVELLGRGKVLVRIGVLGDPNLRVRPSAGSKSVIARKKTA